ncbi:SPOR domain-containing protein [Imhoffiella purpurea]|uniref:SPOR domain-containing protein n=1 Tax=Imhoffiella purpurea TaxID=1249627 RepID=W9V357_9GAMM|nr:SPOR domain-containing protein [Imhoffiella purpurea]EXJ13774.1 hypothetical protein D779_3313 [Imhoffiella purpurea]
MKKPIRPRSPATGRIGLRALALLLPMAVALAEPVQSLPRAAPDSPPDPRWLEQLPPLSLPLPRPSDIVSGPRPEVARTPARPPSHASPSVEPETKPRPERTTAHDMTTAQPTKETPTASQPEPAAQRPPITMADTEPLETTPTGPEPVHPEPPAGIGESSLETARMEGTEPQPPSPAPIVAEPAQPDTPLEAQTPSAAPARTSNRYLWHVQLLAGRSLEKVETDREIFVQRYQNMLGGLELTISRSNYGDARDEFYRLRALEWTNEAEARDWCARLREAGHQCLVTRVSGNGE